MLLKIFCFIAEIMYVYFIMIGRSIIRNRNIENKVSE